MGSCVGCTLYPLWSRPAVAHEEVGCAAVDEARHLAHEIVRRRPLLLNNNNNRFGVVPSWPVGVCPAPRRLRVGGETTTTTLLP